MPTSASQFFDFIDDCSSFDLDCHEIASATFTDLRYSIRSIIGSLSQSDTSDATEISGRLRAMISEWLTVPVCFNDDMCNALQEMGESADVESRWGRDIRNHYDNAVVSAKELVTLENPLRVKVASLIRQTIEMEKTLRIFCHRRARIHFESLLLDYELLHDPDVFIHSVAQYRNIEPVNCLLKVGPLRSRGWGAAPDALISAPRFESLVQVIWSGCGNEPDFGYDPALLKSYDDGSDDKVNDVSVVDASGTAFKWYERKTLSRDNTIGSRGAITDVDDLHVYTQLTKSLEIQAATLVQVDEYHGILYPPHTQVLGFDPNTYETRVCLPGETLVIGMFLILPVIDDSKPVGLQAKDGRYSHVWKGKLKSVFLHDSADLIRRLTDAGLGLAGLDSRIEHWYGSATTVIHAPQQKRHFEILISVLGLDFDSVRQPRTHHAAWWQYAWDEIRRARGEAIQTGMHEHQVVDDQLFSALSMLKSEIRLMLHLPVFEVKIPDSVTVRGVFKFYRVVAVEKDFSVPRNELRELCELERIDQWRD